MVKRMLRSRSLKRKKVRTPGNKLVIQYRRKKPSPAKCGKCKKPLHGIPRERQTTMRNLPKSKKRPERPYGGNLCSSCMRNVIREQVRSSNGGDLSGDT